jgi:hypothetical protein
MLRLHAQMAIEKVDVEQDAMDKVRRQVEKA